MYILFLRNIYKMKISSQLLHTSYANHSSTNESAFIEIWEELERYQDTYHEVLTRNKIWPKNYYWPIDALHTNTRVWEYPFVINGINGTKGLDSAKKLLDIGSALTFFPQYMTDYGYEVTCIDIDKQLVEWANEIIKSNIFNDEFKVFKKPISKFIQEDVSILNLPDNYFDVITNISVLEHIPFNKMPIILKNIHSKLKQDGVFICTLDAYISGDRTSEHMPLKCDELKYFMSMILEYFDLLQPLSLVGVDDLITNSNYPFSRQKHERKDDDFVWRAKRALKYFMNEHYFIDRSIQWTALGFILRKK
jgi:2-polyprenyl-3-methyl-5-hydroxy-6-metoxy-1,4-benzoquinol methylase